MESQTSTPVRSFKDMRVWQHAYRLTIDIYEACKDFPKYEQYGLSSQMCRASVSIGSNIAEGFGRRTYKEKDQFYGFANGSLTELENQVLIAHGIGYISDSTLDVLSSKCETLHKMLITLQKVNKERS